MAAERQEGTTARGGPGGEQTTPRCLVLYSHVPDFASADAEADRRKHKLRVRRLCESLGEVGIECRLDQYLDACPPKEWYQWLNNEISRCDSAILVISRALFQAFKSDQRAQSAGALRTASDLPQSSVGSATSAPATAAEQLATFQNMPDVIQNMKLLSKASSMLAERFIHFVERPDSESGEVATAGRVHPVCFDHVDVDSIPLAYCSTKVYCLGEQLDVRTPGDFRKLCAALVRETLAETAIPASGGPHHPEHQLSHLHSRETTLCQDGDRAGLPHEPSHDREREAGDPITELGPDGNTLGKDSNCLAYPTLDSVDIADSKDAIISPQTLPQNSSQGQNDHLSDVPLGTTAKEDHFSQVSSDQAYESAERRHQAQQDDPSQTCTDGQAAGWGIISWFSRSTPEKSPEPKETREPAP